MTPLSPGPSSRMGVHETPLLLLPLLGSIAIDVARQARLKNSFST